MIDPNFLYTNDNFLINYQIDFQDLLKDNEDSLDLIKIINKIQKINKLQFKDLNHIR